MIVKNIDANRGSFNFIYELRGCNDNFEFTCADWMTVSTSDTNIVTVSYEENISTLARIGYIAANVSQDGTLKCSKNKIKVIQDALGESCNCNNLDISGKTNIDVNGGTSLVIGEIIKDKCISINTAITDATWITSLIIDGNNIKANVSVSTENDPRTATITVKYSAKGSFCEAKQFEVKQNGTSITCNCDNNFSVSVLSTVDNSGCTDCNLGEITKGNCISITNVVARETSDTNSIEVTWISDLTATTEDKITGTVAEGGESNRDAYIHVTASDDTNSCTKFFKITQKGSNCDCDSLIVNNYYDGSDDKFIPSSGSDTLLLLGTIESGDCHANLAIDRSKSSIWLSPMTFENSEIKSNVSKINQKDNRSGVIHIDYKANGNLCSREIIIWQKGHGCDCSNFELSKTDTVEIAKDANTYTINTITTSGVCITDVSATTDATWITAENLVVDGNVIKVTVDANNTSIPRTATIKVSFKADSTSCISNEFELKQSGISYIICPQNGSGTGGTVQFEARTDGICP